MAELDPDRLSVALANHPTATGVPGDLRETWTRAVASWRKIEGDRRPDLLAACPPCQGMSSARSGLGKHDDHEAGGRDPRNLLVTVIEAVAKELKPRVIVVENVPAFLTRQVPHPADGSPISAALLLQKSLEADYEPFAAVADLADWGVPQTRKRAFLTFIRRDEVGLHKKDLAPFPAATHGADRLPHVTIEQSLRILDAKPLDASSVVSSSDPSNPMHFVPAWDPDRYAMVAAIPPHLGGGAWANNLCPSCGTPCEDPDTATCRTCQARLLRPSVKDGANWRLIRGFRNSSYTRMRSAAPASTVTTASGRLGSDRTIHPWENRLLSPYECAHLQTLPADFEWADSLKRWGHTRVREMIGEAVPPMFTSLHGQAILSFLSEIGEATLMPATDNRLEKARRLLMSARAKASPSEAVTHS